MSRWPIVCLALGCGAQVDASGSDSTSTSTASSTTASTTATTTTTTSSGTSGADGSGGSDDGGYEDDSGGTGCVFTCPPPPTTGGGGGGGTSIECDLAQQDCPDGEKCMPWANDGGPAWNATRCAPLDPSPSQADEPCTVEGSGVSGIDNCALGTMCWDVNPKDNTGVCRQLCVDPSATPCVGGHACVGFVDEIVELCIEGCDPLAPTCKTGSCVPMVEGFACRPGGAQALGDPCAVPHDCASGSLCVAGTLLDDCASVGCCTAACELGAADTCSGGMGCVAWDPDAVAPWDDVGVCVTP